MTTNHPVPTPARRRRLGRGGFPMTAEPRDVEEIRADLKVLSDAIDDLHGMCSEQGEADARVMIRLTREQLAADVEPLLDRLAAADRENVELRGEVERLREGYRVVCDQAERADSLQFQLAAAQAQLAEVTDNGRWIKPARAASYYDAIVRRAVTWPGWGPFYTAAGAPDDDAMVAFLTAEHERADAAEARLEAVRAIAAKAAATPRINDPFCVGMDIADDLRAVLSAAPQPEPDVRAENLRRLRQRPCCRDHADATAEPPASDEPDDQSDSPNVGSPADEAASDEPARCEHDGGPAASCNWCAPSKPQPEPPASGPAASGTPDGGSS